MGVYRVLVTGSRDWDDDPLLCIQLAMEVQNRGPDDIAVIVHGACPTGADKTADIWASNHHVAVERHPAEWRPGGQFDRSAGFRRNAQMVAAGADVCLAFIRSGSRGATHCARLAERAGIPVRLFRKD